MNVPRNQKPTAQPAPTLQYALLAIPVPESAAIDDILLTHFCMSSNGTIPFSFVNLTCPVVCSHQRISPDRSFKIPRRSPTAAASIKTRTWPLPVRTTRSPWHPAAQGALSHYVDHDTLRRSMSSTKGSRAQLSDCHKNVRGLP